MNALKIRLIQQILETQDESLLKMLWEIVKLNQEHMENQQMLEPTFSDYANMHSSDIQQSIDSFLIPNLQKTIISNMYEYKFIRIRTSIWSGLPKQDYRKVIQTEAKEGWRLIQILTPTGISMLPSFYELIFERLKAEFV